MGLRVSGPGALGHAGRAHPALLDKPGGHTHPGLAILSGAGEARTVEKEVALLGSEPRSPGGASGCSGPAPGAVPRARSTVSTGQGDAGKSAIPALGPHPENCDPEPPSPRRKHTSALPSEGGPTAGPAGWAAVHAAVTQKQGRDDEPHTPTPGGLNEEGRGQPSVCTLIG